MITKGETIMLNNGSKYLSIPSEFFRIIIMLKELRTIFAYIIGLIRIWKHVIASESMKIITAYYSLLTISLSFLFLAKKTGIMSGSMTILIGKKVEVMLPIIGS